MPHGLQEVFAREDLRNLLKAYEARAALTGVRRGLGEQHPWEDAEFRSPAPRVNWTNQPNGERILAAAAADQTGGARSETRRSRGASTVAEVECRRRSQPASGERPRPMCKPPIRVGPSQEPQISPR